MNEKDCTPKNCPHAKLLADARAACTSCTSPTCTPDTCPNAALLERARAACLACTCGGKPAGHGGQVSFEAAGEAVVERSAAYIDRSPREQVTTLPPAVEGKVADLLRGWLDLSAIEVLLVHHICNGGTTNTFGDKLAKISEKIASMNPQRTGMRATAWAQWKSIMRRFPFMAKLQSWKPRHGGAVSPLRYFAKRHFEGQECRMLNRQKKKILAEMPADIRQLPPKNRSSYVNQMLGFAMQQHKHERRRQEDDERVQWMIEQERMKREIGQAASGVQPSAPAGPTTAPAQPTAAATLSAHGAP